MRILHCSDFHGHEAWFNWLAKCPSGYDLICLTGDHLDLLNMRGMERQLRMIRTALERVATPLAICSGNNDSCNGPMAPVNLLHGAWLKELRRPGLHVDGEVFVMERLRFRCVGWNSPLPTAAGDEVWLYHAPPARSPLAIDPSGGDVGDELLDEMCRADLGPAMVLAGHQHTPRHWLWRLGQTWTLNPGRGHDHRVPNHIVIDTVQRSVALHRAGEPIFRIPLGYPA